MTLTEANAAKRLILDMFCGDFNHKTAAGLGFSGLCSNMAERAGDA